MSLQKLFVRSVSGFLGLSAVRFSDFCIIMQSEHAGMFNLIFIFL